MNAREIDSHHCRKRIAHLTTVHSPFDVRIFHKECKSLVRAGYDVTLIACHEKNEVRNGVRIRAVPSAAGRFARMVAATWKVYREAVSLDADLYHFHDPELLPAGLLLRFRGKAVVYDVHEDVSADIATKQYIPKMFRGVCASAVSLLETMSASLFSAVAPATPTIAARFASRHLPQVVLSNYPVVEEFQLTAPVPWPLKSMAVAYVGVISRNRCVDEMIRAMSILPGDLGAALKLVGDFSPASLPQDLGLLPGWEHTEALGVLDRVGVAKVLGNVRAGLVVLKSTPAFVHSVPIKMFEYMCAGIPVIASNFPGFAEVVNGARCGLLVDPDSPRAIADAIEFVLTHPQEAQEMGKRGHEAVLNRYNWGSEEQKLIQLYGTLLNTPCVA